MKLVKTDWRNCLTDDAFTDLIKSTYIVQISRSLIQTKLLTCGIKLP